MTTPKTDFVEGAIKEFEGTFLSKRRLISILTSQREAILEEIKEWVVNYNVEEAFIEGMKADLLAFLDAGKGETKL